jgi:tRNA pseudouridine13 synthase
MKKIYAYNHQPIYFDFKQSSDRFYVEEIPLFKFTNRGSNLILKIKKSNISTFKLITVLAKATNLEYRDIGYAGLKDKNATTIQYISIPKKYEKEILSNLTSQKIEILEKSYNRFPIKIGNLKGNRFSIILNRVTPKANINIRAVALQMQKEGIPNYYGYQRFGKDSKSYKQGREIAHSGKRLRGAKEKLLVSAYQSYYFNAWLSKRVEISKMFNAFDIKELKNLFIYNETLIRDTKNQSNFFKMLPGDILHHYPYGKAFECVDIKNEIKRFANKDITVTGILPGKKTKLAKEEAGIIEKEFISECDKVMHIMQGSRRFAWIFPEIFEFKYKKEEAWFELGFFLPKGSYATVLVEEILHKI